MRSNESSGEGSSRACNACRRMKIRCIDKDSPPCRRCKTLGVPCSFEANEVVVDRNPRHRLDALESQMSSINDKLDGFDSLMRSFLAASQPSDFRPPVIEQSSSQVSATTGNILAPPLQGQPAASTSPASLEGFVKWMGAQPGAPSSSRTNPIEQDRHVLSASSSEMPTSDDDDPLDAAVRMEALSSLTQREEAARLRQEGHDEPRGDATGQMDDSGPSEDTRRSSRKRHRALSEAESARPALVRRRGDLSRTFLDPVRLGICSEQEGRSLYNLFFEHSHPFMPVLDPLRDTWSDLRQRSAFCTTVILLVAAQVADRGTLLERTKQLRQAAETMAKVTLFSPVSHLETVQAMILLASWSDVVWRPACHAMTLAVDMDMHRCLPTLHKTGMGAGKEGEALEKDRPLVVGARLWLALSKLSYEVAFNHGRPIAFLQDSVMQLGRGLLSHPLSTLSDTRFVVSVELQACRLCLFRPFDLVPAHERHEVLEQTRLANKTIERLHDFWTTYYDNAGLQRDHFLQQELGSQKAYAQLRTSSLTLHGIKDKQDVALLSDDRRENMRIVIRSSAFLVSSIGSGLQAKNSEYGNHYFHVEIISTARFLIRLIGLMPGECDPSHVAADVENLISNMPKFPGYSFLSLLQNDLKKARQEGLLPVRTDPSPLNDELSLNIPAAASQPTMSFMESNDWSTNQPLGNPPVGTNAPQCHSTDSFGFPWLDDMDFSQSFAPLLALPPINSDHCLLPDTFDIPDLFNGSMSFDPNQT